GGLNKRGSECALRERQIDGLKNSETAARPDLGYRSILSLLYLSLHCLPPRPVCVNEH
ncbi:hypothetical protein J6590_093344, partial [Homalodisca vitripennis]